MSTNRPSTKPAAKTRIERIALGSDRAAKIMAVRAAIARIAQIVLVVIYFAAGSPAIGRIAQSQALERFIHFPLA